MAASPSLPAAALSPVAAPSALAAASPSAPSTAVSSAGFSGSFTIDGAATVAITKSLPVIVGTTLLGNVTEEIHKVLDPQFARVKLKLNDLIGRIELMLNLIPLILQTDSSRVVSLMIQDHGVVPQIAGISKDQHGLSHHGQDATNIAQLKIIETEIIKRFGNLLTEKSAIEIVLFTFLFKFEIIE